MTPSRYKRDDYKFILDSTEECCELCVFGKGLYCEVSEDEEFICWNTRMDGDGYFVKKGTT